MNAQDRFSPVGHWVVEVTAGQPTGPRRFIYDADVRRVVELLAARHPGSTDRATETAARWWIYKLGPEHPALVDSIALDMGLIETKEA